MCFGDSNTYGYDPRSYLGGRYPRSVRWTGRLEEDGWEVFNQGENGRSIPRLDFEIEAAGSNDLLQCPGLTARVCGEQMERFLPHS